MNLKSLCQAEWQASWSSGHGHWLLIMRSRVPFPVLPWEFSLQGKIPVVTIVWVVSRFRLKAPPGISSSCISPLTSSGQRSCASWASQPQKSATLSPQPGGKPRKFIRTCGGIGRGGKCLQNIRVVTTLMWLRIILDHSVFGLCKNNGYYSHIWGSIIFLEFSCSVPLFVNLLAPELLFFF